MDVQNALPTHVYVCIVYIMYLHMIIVQLYLVVTGDVLDELLSLLGELPQFFVNQ